MSKFKEKLKYLLIESKEKENNKDFIFNNSLLKIHKIIKGNKNNIRSSSSNNIKNKNNLNIVNSHFLEENKLKNYSFIKLKKSKSTNNFTNILRTFSIYDFHLNNSKNKYKTIISPYNNKKLNYINKYNKGASDIKHSFRSYMNCTQRKINTLDYNLLINYKENIFLNNLNKASTNHRIHNSFRKENKFESNNNKYLTDFSLRHILLNKKLKK